MTSHAPAGVGAGRPPVPAVLAAGLAVLSALVPAGFFLVALAFSAGSPSGPEWLVLLVPLALALALLLGSVLLLLGRSWFVVAVPAGVMGVAIIGGTLFGGWAEGALGFGLVTGLMPAVAAVLAALPGVRGWVAARRVAGP